MADTNIKWNGIPIDSIERDSLSLNRINENGTIMEMVDTINANFLNIAKHGGGPAGIDGSDGSNGVDGSNVEYIYALCDEMNPGVQYPTITKEIVNLFDSVKSAGSHSYKEGGVTVTWFDNAQPISIEHKNEYVWSRIKRGIGLATDWYYEPKPVLWAHWGEIGKDGDGVEYIFLASSNELTSISLNTSLLKIENMDDFQKAIFNIDDFYPGKKWFNSGNNKQKARLAISKKGLEISDSLFDTRWSQYFNFCSNTYSWTDEPTGTGPAVLYEYVSIRKSTTGENDIKMWGDFSTPALWSNYNLPTKSVIIYCNLNKNVTPEPPVGGWVDMSTGKLIVNKFGYELTPDYWKDTNDDIEEGQMTWMSNGVFDHTGKNAYWSYPVRITGKDGKNGEDGTLIEFIYALTAYGQQPDYPDIANKEQLDILFDNIEESTTSPKYSIYGSTKWYDRAQEISADIPVEYMAQRSKKHKEKEWTYTEPIIWSHWGEDGTDGDGVEYIFAITKTNSNDGLVLPVYSSLNDSQKKIFQIDDFVPSEEWFNKPKSKQKAQEILGESFNNIEWSNYYGFNISAKWSDNPTEVSPFVQYQWVSIRRSHADERTGDRFWEDFSTPVLWNNYSQTSMTFVVYCNMSDETTPKSPVAGWWNTSNDTLQMSKTNTNEYRSNALSSGTPDYTSYVGYWSDNNIDVRGTITWISTGEFNDSIDNNGSNNIYWSKPFRITGETGEPGEDGSNMQFVYALCDDKDSLKYPQNGSTTEKNNFFDSIESAGTNGYKYVGTTWYDHPQGIANEKGKRTEWVWSRSKPAGYPEITEWETPPSPVVWSHWGEDGTDGDGVEYIFARSTQKPLDSIDKPYKVSELTTDVQKVIYNINDFFPGEGWFTSDNKTIAKKALEDAGITLSTSQFNTQWNNRFNIIKTSSDPNVIVCQWWDNPRGVDLEHPFEFVAIRKSSIDTEGKKVWGDFSDPALWSEYPIKSRTFIIYCNVDEGVTPIKPNETDFIWNVQNDSLVKNNSTSIWSDKDIDVPGKIAWLCSGLFAENGNVIFWSEPFRITGEEGKKGADGSNMQFVYALCDDKDSLKYPQNGSTTEKNNFFDSVKSAGTNGYKYVGTTWYDHPQGVLNENGKRTEWVWSRSKPAGYSEITQWETPQSAVVWSHWGEDGTDGDGVEYMFLTSNSETYNTPTENNWNKVFDNFIGSTSDTVKYTYAMSDFLPTVVWLNTNKTAVQAKMQKDGKTFSESDWAGINTTISNANLGDLWKDNPSNINSNYKYQFVSIRKMNDGIWGPFSYPKLWSKYAIIKFKSIAFAATTIDTDLSRCTVTGGSFSKPLPTLTKKGNQTINVTWTDGPEPNASTGKTQIWMTSANVSEDSTSALVWSAPQKMTDTTNLQVEWSSTDKSYTELASINQSLTQSKYNFGTFLKNNSYNENTAEFAWRTTMSNDFNISFDDNPENAILMATCQLQNGVWSDWKITRVKGEKGDRGDKGDKGDDGKPGEPGNPGEAGNGYQYKYIRYNNSTNYGGSTTCTVTNASSDNPVFKIGTVIVPSTDSAQGVDFNHTYEYRSERYGHAGRWSNWSNPVVIARYLNDNDIKQTIQTEVATATSNIETNIKNSFQDTIDDVAILQKYINKDGVFSGIISDGTKSTLLSGYINTDNLEQITMSGFGTNSETGKTRSFSEWLNYEDGRFSSVNQTLNSLNNTLSSAVTAIEGKASTTALTTLEANVDTRFGKIENTVANGGYVTDSEGYLLVKESDGSKRRALNNNGNPVKNYIDVRDSDREKLIYITTELATISQTVSNGIAATSIVTSTENGSAIFFQQVDGSGSKIIMNADIIDIQSKYFNLNSSGLEMRGNLLAKDGSGNITAGVIGNDTAGNDIKFFAGTNAEILERSKAPFRVYEDGSIYASKGKVGPLNVQSRNIYIGNYDENHYTRIDEDGIEIKNDNFVSKITASNIDMYGSFKRRCAYLIGNLSNSNWEGEGSSNAEILENLKNKYEIYSSNSYNLTNVIKRYDLINTISCRNVTIPSDPAFIGRHLTLMTGNPLSPYICEIVKNNGLNYELSVTGTDTFMFSDSQNCKFYENGGESSTLKLSNEGVDLFGIGINNEFKGFIVSNRFNINTEYDYGSTFRCLGMFCFNEKKLIGSYTFNGLSGTITNTGSSYVTISTPFNVNDPSKIFVDITPVGNTITGLTYNSEINLNNTILTITIYSSDKGIKSEFRVLVYNLGDFSTLTSDSTTPPSIIKEEYKRTGSSMPYQNIGMTGLIFSCQKSESYSIRIYVNGPTKRVHYALSAGGSDFTFTPSAPSHQTTSGESYQSTSGNTYIDIGDVATKKYNDTNRYNIGSIRITLYETEFLTSTTEGVTLYIPLEQDYYVDLDDGRS